ncbi:mitotic control protein dis3 [Metarhizium acridum CQMa 102]|uniref:Chromosome disjunction protein 3 n=1 Tax=Metarhizium acridum (strain CQMa 102) TaxID=655827 RepID=E9E2U5_METAQ|nr:mitotic control protein dis3 [Metarhizium acridum CQMa 102]EFY89761.1 mitotic control protein dis3 [Metarhizium acridum CQMa 102]
MTSLKRSHEGDPLASSISSKVYVRSTRSAQPFVLSEKPAATKAFRQGHYLVPDTNALLNAMDLFEQSSAFYDVIILQTVLEELRNRSLPLYNRLIGLTKSEDKRFYVFFNDFRLETYVNRELNESVNDRNDRAVRLAVKWYGEHLSQTKAGKVPAIVMLSDDQENLKKARSQGLNALSLRDYVGSLEDGDKLLDMVAETQSLGGFKKQSQMLYPEYFSLSRMMTGVKAGLMHQGIFNVSPYNYLEGSIKVPAFSKPLLILGRESINRAVDGDVVVVEMLPQDKWKAPSTKIIEEDNITKNENADTEDRNDFVSDKERKALQEEAKRTHKSSSESQLQPTAKVVGVIKRNWRQYVGHIDPSSASKSASSQGRKQDSVFLIPMDKKIPKIRLRTRQVSELLGKRLLVTIDAWERDSRHPVGHFVRSLGELETKAAETEALLLEWDVQYRPFPKTVLDCLPKEGHDWKVPASVEDPGWKDREDLRGLLICSIDPVGCQDIDDALHARKLPNGNFEVGVHIADVSHFVKPANAMDTEASIRGTTVYLVDKRIDMLPPLLGTDLCSLKPYVERYAFSVLWELNDNADIVNVRFTKSVIKSREAFSYEQAQLRIDDTSQQDELTNGMRMLLALSKKLKKKRMDAGALSLSSPEVKVQMESETSDPIDVKTKELLDTNSLVEEFMLFANVSVAAKIYDAFPQTAILRRHAPPPKTNFDELADQLRVKRGFELRTDTSKALADSLDACVDKSDPFFNTLVRIMATRCMMSAEYFCSGTQAYPEFRHYGLASEIYTHFTSPIRRYADLLAHRQLAAAIGYEAVHPSVRSRGRLEAVCKNINVRHRNAQMAGRASTAYYVGQALKGNVAEEDAFVMKIFSNGFVVLVPRFGIEGLIRLRDLAEPEPESEFDAETYTLVTRGSRDLKVELFQRVKVKVMDEKDERTGKRGVKMVLVTA